MEKLILPDGVEDAIREALEEAGDELGYQLDSWDTNLSEVCHKAYDGFIPFTNGGFRLMSYTSLASLYASGKTFNNERLREQVEKYIADDQKSATEDFIGDNKEDICDALSITEEELDDMEAEEVYQSLQSAGDGLDKTLPMFPDKPQPSHVSEEVLERMNDFCYEWMQEGSELWGEMRVHYYEADNRRGEKDRDTVWFAAGANFDFTYGRDKGFDIVREVTVPARRLTPERARRIIQLLVAEV